MEFHPKGKEESAFTTGRNLHQFIVLPFGLINAPAIFERLMEMVLVVCPGKAVCFTETI